MATGEANRVLVGILTLQGAAQDHIPHLSKAGAHTRMVRERHDLDGIDALILPGGESSVIGIFLERYGLKNLIRDRVLAGMPVWGICAGSILLARRVDGEPGILNLLPLDVRRNYYGRHSASGWKPVESSLFWPGETLPMPFIRAPQFSLLPGEDTTISARTVSGEPVAVMGGAEGQILATAFHPEITDCDTIHRWLVGKVKSFQSETPSESRPFLVS